MAVYGNGIHLYIIDKIFLGGFIFAVEGVESFKKKTIKFSFLFLVCFSKKAYLLTISKEFRIQGSFKATGDPEAHFLTDYE